MGKLVCVFAMSHAPGATGWPDKAEPGERENFLNACKEMSRRLYASRPDVIIGIGNEHVLNFFFDLYPDYCVGVAERHDGPAEFFKEWLNVPDYSVPGKPDLAASLVQQGALMGIKFAFSERLLLDDNFSVPLTLLTPKMDIPFVPIPMNCIVPPLPANEYCYRVGQTIKRIVEEHRPAGERVALMATGGLSHDPGGKRYFDVDEKFDRWFLSLMEQGDPEKVLREVTLDRMLLAGDGGTTELLAWMTVMGAVGARKAEVLAYEPIRAWRCGMGVIDWRVPAD